MCIRDRVWPVPVVWNCGGYEKPETLKMLEGRVQVYLPDLKYALPGAAKRYSGAEDYFDWAKAVSYTHLVYAILETILLLRDAE